MSHWFVRSFLALLLCCFGTMASSAPLIGEAGRKAFPAGPTSQVAAAAQNEPGPPFGHPTDVTTPGLVDVADDTLKVHADGATDNLDLFNAQAHLIVLASAPAAPEGWNGLSIQTPFLSKLRRPPR